MSTQMLRQFSDIVGASYVRTDADSLQQFGTDRTTLWPAAPKAVVLPESTEQIQQLVKLANAERIGLVPSGGRTGLSGGAVAANGEIVLALDRMNRLLEMNPVDQTAHCQAGVITRQLQEAAEAAGLFYPVDFASAGSSQIGGNIATNAGGIKVIRYGMTRDWVRGLKVVTGAGELLDLNKGLVKNNSGYDLRQLFIGSEGTLGIICEAIMQLTRPPQDLRVMVLAVRDFAAIMDVLKTFKAQVELSAFEFFSDRALQEVLLAGHVAEPFATRAPHYVLLEVDCVTSTVGERAEEAFVHCLEHGWVLDGVASQTQTQALNLWRLREDIPELMLPHRPYKNDISVRVSRLPEFVSAIDTLVAERYQGFEVAWYGHIGDGNLHLNILKPEQVSQEHFAERCHEVSAELADIVQRFDGSISAEHGVGLLKKAYLTSTRSVVEIEMMRQLKGVFDPNRIMNPGKMFD